MTENKNTHTDSRLQIEARNNPRVAFGLRWEEADEKVQKIKDYLDSLYDHTGPIHWGHVGDMSRLNGYLDLALQLIGLAPKDWTTQLSNQGGFYAVHRLWLQHG